MSPSNSLALVIPVRNTNDSPISDKVKAPAKAVPKASPAPLDNEYSAAFAWINSADCEKLKQELFKCFPEPYIKGLRGASSGHVGYMSQHASKAY